MRIAIDTPPVRSLSANEKMVYQFLKEGYTPQEIGERMKIPVGRGFFQDNLHDVPNDTVCLLISKIREKGWNIPNDNKEEDEMPRPSRFSAEEKRSIVTEYKAGATMTKIAEKYGASKSMIHYIVQDYKEHGEAAFAPAITDEELERAYGNDTPCYEVTGDTDMEAYMADRNKKEPATAATETGSEQETCEDIPADIIPENPEDVKPESEENAEPLIPQAVIEACWGRMDELRNQIAAEQAVIDDWKRQIAEIKDFLELARIANPLGGTV